MDSSERNILPPGLLGPSKTFRRPMNYIRSVVREIVNYPLTMAAKRKAPHDTPPAVSSTHPSRAHLLPASARPKKKQRAASAAFRPSIPPNHTSVLRKRIRDLQRKLALPHLPADIRVEDERALQAHTQDLTALEQERERARMIGKYHMVRFFGTRSPVTYVFSSPAQSFQRDKRPRAC